MELHAQVDMGGNPNGPSNTQFRHELSEQRPPLNMQSQLSYSPVALRYHPRSWRGFSIPSKTNSLSSGFIYDQRLHMLQVSNEQWHQFSSDVVNSAKLTIKDDYAAWTAGVTTGAISSPFILVFGPIVGWYTGKAVHKKTVVTKVKERLLEDGKLRSVLRKWNEGAWADRGFHTWIEFPDDPGIFENRSDAKRFRIVIIPNDVIHSPLQQQMSPQMLSGKSPMQQWSHQQSQGGQFGAPEDFNQNMAQQYQNPPKQISELPNNQSNPVVIAELPSSPVNSYELDGGGVQPAHRKQA